MKRGDLIAGGIVLAAATVAGILLLLPGGTAKTVVIKQDNKIIYRVSLDTDRTLTLPGNTVIIKNGTVWISDADCKNQICVQHAPICKSGECILCLPNRVSVTVEE